MPMLKRYAAALAAALTVGGTALAQSPDMKVRSVENGAMQWEQPQASPPRK